jgi:hypothetical protein
MWGCSWTRLLRDFELDGSAGLSLDDRCAVAQPAADAQIVDLQTDEIAAPQFAVDRQVEHCEVAFARLDLKADPDIPHFLGLEWALLAYEASLVPGACPWSRCWLSVLDMDVTSLSDPSSPET